jgi:hypothetical protein
VPAFIPGLQLSHLFYEEAVRPLLEEHFPELPYSAGLLGYGSEVQGFDTERSTDHNWGPRLLLFLREEDAETQGPKIRERLENDLPPEIHGYPTRFSSSDGGTTFHMGLEAGEPVGHKVEITSTRRFLMHTAGLPGFEEMEPLDWLSIPQQNLREITGGRVFGDGLGELEHMRATFAYYPRDIWLYLLSAQWARIGQLEPFVGRCGEVGDNVGSALVAASQVRDVMRLAFLLERTYAPYPKWFGTGFARLDAAPELLPHLEAALTARSWHERERHLTPAYEALARRFNKLGLVHPLPETVSSFHDRPFMVIHGERFAEALAARIEDPRVRALPLGVGGVDQWIDSVDVLDSPEMLPRLRGVYWHNISSWK